MLYLFNRDHLEHFKEREIFRKAFIITADFVGPQCRYIKYRLIAPANGQTQNILEDFVRKEQTKRREQIERILDWIEENSWNRVFDLFVFFMDPKEIDFSESRELKFDHHDDTCCWGLNLSEEEFKEFKNVLVAEGLPIDLFITKAEAAQKIDELRKPQVEMSEKQLNDMYDQLAHQLHSPNLAINAAYQLLATGDGIHYLASELADLNKPTRGLISPMVRAKFPFEQLKKQAKDDEFEGVHLLGISQYPMAFEVLMEILNQKLQTQTYTHTVGELQVWYVIDALGLLGDKRALPKLKELEKDGLPKYKDIDIQKCAKIAIRNLQQ